jgi:hypothetical protein
MLQIPKTAEDASQIKRIVHNTESIYGILVSLDDRPRSSAPTSSSSASTTAARSPEINERVITPVREGLDRRAHQGQGLRQGGRSAVPGDRRDGLSGHRGRRRGLKKDDVIVSATAAPSPTALELAADIERAAGAARSRSA